MGRTKTRIDVDQSEASNEVSSVNLTAEQKARLHEVADAMLEIYQTLVQMRYVHPNALIRGPHKFSNELMDAYKRLNLDTAVIYLYSIMPYIDEIETDVRDFFQGGAFFNQMRITDVERGRDPCYASPRGGYDDEDGEYMYPWYTPLSNCGNHSPIIIYDTRQHRIWIIEQIDRRSTDPVFCKGWYEDVDAAEDEKSDWGGSGSSDWSDDNENDIESEGSSECWMDEDDQSETEELAGLIADQAEVVEYDEGFEQIEELSEWEQREAVALKNENSLEFARYRDAGDVLRDINRWYRELKEIPGQGEYTHWLEPRILRPLYRKNGWPEDFNGDEFEIDMARAGCVEGAKYHAEEPLRKVQCYQGWAEHGVHDIERWTKSIETATTVDDEWRGRFEVFRAERNAKRNARDLEEAKIKAEQLCPGGIFQRDEDLPLWEMEQLRVETRWRRERVNRDKEEGSKEDVQGDSTQQRWIKAGRVRTERQLEVYEKAFQLATAEAERLRPGVTFYKATGIRFIGREDTVTSLAQQKRLVAELEETIRQFSKFLENVPDEAPKTRIEIRRLIDQDEGWLRGSRSRLKTLEKTLVEHGNVEARF